MFVCVCMCVCARVHVCLEEDNMQNELKTGSHRQTHTDTQSTNVYDLFS